MLNDVVFTYRVLKESQKPTFKKLTRTLDRLASDSITSNGMHKPEPRQRKLLRFELAQFWFIECF